MIEVDWLELNAAGIGVSKAGQTAGDYWPILNMNGGPDRKILKTVLRRVDLTTGEVLSHNVQHFHGGPNLGSIYGEIRN